ncbi:unnamed protein product [Schistosoma spindalis]|nr:unnamed protein product [Schistosoma spindale]
MLTFVNLCSPHKRLRKCTANYVINNNHNHNNNNNNNNNNQYINVQPISKEKLKKFFYRLDQFPFIDEMYHNDEYQNMYASFDKFSINYMDNEKEFIKNQSFTRRTSGKLCGCFTTR